MPQPQVSTTTRNPFNLIVIVAALGYFVDIYDLILFGIVRKPSLIALGVPAEALQDTGIFLLNMQMIGMLLGGIVWGIMGDKLGRLSTLFGTIIMYSIANFANGFVQNVEQYAIMRFIAGFGLAGELGVGITLVSEVMTQESRGWGTSIVSGVGIAGAAVGFFVTKFFDWQAAYFVGGILGIALLVFRILVHESGMFAKIKHTAVKKGEFFCLFTSRSKFMKFLWCILIGVPIWYVIGLLTIFAPEFSTHVAHVNGSVDGATAILYCYVGASFGSLAVGTLSQLLKSRKQALFIALTILTVLIALYFSLSGISSGAFYLLIAALGFISGYWAVFVTSASEQFGTNLRSTVTTSVPNFVRGSTVLITLLFKWLRDFDTVGMLGAGIIVGALVLGFAFFAASRLEETYHKNLDYVEDI